MKKGSWSIILDAILLVGNVPFEDRQKKSFTTSRSFRSLQALFMLVSK